MLRVRPLLFKICLLLLAALASLRPVAAGPFDLTNAQRARLQKFMPRTYPKLAKKEPVRVLLVGDSVTSMYVHSDDDSDTLKSYAGGFLSLLGDQFYYSGGLRVIRPGKGLREKAIDIFGPEILVRNASRGGKLMIHAMNVLSAAGWDEEPDLVIVNFGINDANSRHSLARYQLAVRDVIDAVKSHHADLILLGSTPTITDPPERGLALTRPYVDTVRELAADNGVFFADLGDLAWLVRVDERMKGLERPALPKGTEDGAKREPKDEGRAPTEGRTPGAIIDFPVSAEADPDPEKRSARLFQQIAGHLRGWFDHGTEVDPIHPNSQLHRLLGRRLFDEMLNGPRMMPWSIGPALAEFGKDEKTVTVSFRVENTSASDLRVNLLPLIGSGWKPQEADSQLDLKPGRKGVVRIVYAREGGNDATPPHEPLLRLPVLVIGAGFARIEEVRSRLTPLGVVWKTPQGLFNQENEFTLAGEIANSTGEPLSGEWSAECLGQKLAGKFTAPPRGVAPVALRFNLPQDGIAGSRRTSPVKFRVATGESTLEFNRDVELVQNFGLKGPVPLHGAGRRVGAAPGDGVAFRADADATAIYFTWDISGINLVDDERGVALQAEVNLDARSYGKRLARGVTDAIRVACAAADGSGDVAMQPWAPGNGYGAGRMDTKSAQARLTSRPDGSRRLTLMLPRSLFQLHEWALGNGNSILGIGTTLNIWQRPDERNPGGSNGEFVLVSSPMHRDDAESLAALELTAQPTARWTVHFF